MPLTIHGIPASRAIRPLWAATELGLAFNHVPTPYLGGATRTPGFLALNPNGHIPVVVDARPDGDVVVWESMACALYIARHHGQPDGASITPANPREDAEALRWSFWAVTECEADALTVLMHRLAMPAERRKPELAQAAEKRLAVRLRVMEQHLTAQQAAGCLYLAAERFTVADLCVASVLNWARPARELMKGHPLTHDWIVRCTERPAHDVARALG
ncbi:glutathione S-transferase family protein [Hydrogenophaga sp. A37]|uniref:glutathione S-transferase family protein n=1 Tax=Hydrogenophaga sp. A37 TaxID=1945864 RepID=UPI0009873ABE|nr:glutathione S-transferase family protein [Hydrogenophaga sp. A37]OOG84145.1 glutathione S-transferase [Hydrogenophaga sp. A37]